MPNLDDQEWLDWRRQGIGASDSPTICGVRKKPSRLELWLEKTGQAQTEWDPMTLIRFARGKAMEDQILQEYQEITGERIGRIQIRVQNSDMPWMRATLDARTERGRIVEFKTAGYWMSKHLGPDGSVESLPEEWILQGQHQMFAAEDYCSMDFAVMLPEPPLRIFRLEHDAKLCQHIVTLASAFQRSVETRTMPTEFQPDDAAVLGRYFKQDTGEILDWTEDENMLGKVEDCHRHAAKLREYEKVSKREKAEILAALGNASGARLSYGWSITRKLIEKKAESKPRAGYTYVDLRVKGPKEGDPE